MSFNPKQVLIQEKGIGELGPGTKVAPLGFAFLGFWVFGQPGGRRSGLCPIGAEQS